MVLATVAFSGSASALEGKYTIQSGDTLSKVAQRNETTWEKLWEQNPYIVNPNLIYAGKELTIKPVETPPATPPAPTPVTIPTPAVCNEATQWVRADNGQCKDKPVAQNKPVVKKQTVVRAQASAAKPAPVRSTASFGGGNTYTPGQCTWHVKNLRGASLPNGLGNANQWYYRAKSMGLSTGTSPAVGAAGVRKYGNHVVYVTAVHGNGTITVSEMNYNWTPYAKRTAVKNASDFYYIY